MRYFEKIVGTKKSLDLQHFAKDLALTCSTCVPGPEF